MNREEAVNWIINITADIGKAEHRDLWQYEQALYEIRELLEERPEQRWIPCTPDTMPDDLEEVYVTWVNHNPPWYYTEIKDKPFTAPAVYHRGKWYWYSSVCVDTLAEYGKNTVDEVDKDIEIVAWCKMPEPYRGEQE